jgi:hypothetical protein
MFASAVADLRTALIGPVGDGDPERSMARIVRPLPGPTSTAADVGLDSVTVSWRSNTR